MIHKNASTRFEVVMRNQRSPMGQGKSDEHPPYEELTVEEVASSKDFSKDVVTSQRWRSLSKARHGNPQNFGVTIVISEGIWRGIVHIQEELIMVEGHHNSSSSNKNLQLGKVEAHLIREEEDEVE
ncbi:hypothetical protein Taro_002695 [Colocasia esculenta]|uniref:Uncharacterized protein n=1 Tax=Colocasia esculenta TaxID=4460 RepID=A0A843THB3_COLES|nr:hypothetical protein [Colocasia esculenta]